MPRAWPTSLGCQRALWPTVFVLISETPAFAQAFIPLGTLPGATDSLAYAISADGSTVVGVSSLRAFRWTEEHGIEELFGPPGTVYISPNSVSADGSVVVGEMLVVGSRAFRWTAATGVVDLGVPPGSIQSWATGVSGDGLVIGGYVEINPTHSFRWTQGGGFQLLGTLPGGIASYECHLSGDGSVIVGVSGSAKGTRGFRWTAPEGMQNLGVPPGYNFSNARAVSSDGLVVTGVVSAGGTSTKRAFRWTSATGMQALESTSEGLGLSSDGSVLVGFVSAPGGNAAFFWTAERGVTPLQSVIQSVVPAGWTLNRASAVSADGLRIVGTGQNPAGRNEAFLATLTPEMLTCYANCDQSTAAPTLNVNDFICFLNRYAAFDARANCDGSTLAPVLNVNDFTCFLNRYAAGCP